MSPGVYRASWEGAHEQISTKHDIQDASHQELDQLRHVDQFAAEPLPEHFLRDLLVAEVDLVAVTFLVRLFVKAVYEDLPGVAADVSDANHGRDGPVTTVEDAVRQGNDKHALKEQGRINK